jgi:hypothetical protein
MYSGLVFCDLQSFRHPLAGTEIGTREGILQQSQRHIADSVTV